MDGVLRPISLSLPPPDGVQSCQMHERDNAFGLERMGL
jgi:hypothetical protein